MTRPQQPRDDKGQFVPLECPDPDCGGRLRYVVRQPWCYMMWLCDGLVGRGVEPLEACTFMHEPGEPYDPWPAHKAKEIEP